RVCVVRSSTRPSGVNPALEASMTSPASREAIASAIGLRHAFPRQTNKTFVLATFFIGADSPNFSLGWRNQESNPSGKDLYDSIPIVPTTSSFPWYPGFFFLDFLLHLRVTSWSGNTMS